MFTIFSYFLQITVLVVLENFTFERVFKTLIRTIFESFNNFIFIWFKS